MKFRILDEETHGECGILRISDGTQCKLNMKSYNSIAEPSDGGNGDSNTQFLCKEGLLDLDMFVYGDRNMGRVFSRAREDSYVVLKSVRCLREDLQVLFLSKG